MINIRFILPLLISACIANACLAMDKLDGHQEISQKILQAMSTLKQEGLHKECHENIFRLAAHLRAQLSGEEIAQINVMVIRPHEKNRNDKYLPNSNWFHHVVLVAGNKVFDFFIARETEESISDYLYENFFNLLDSYKSNIRGLVYDDYNRYYFSGFSSFALIDKAIGINSMTVSLDDYLNCVINTVINFDKIKAQTSCIEGHHFYNKREFLSWYKRRFNDIIIDVDTFYLWDDLYQLQYEVILGLRNSNTSASTIANEVVDSFEWPELKALVKRWESGELSAPKYIKIVQDAPQ